jgi:tetratricopeptide (TPR) repeat protein
MPLRRWLAPIVVILITLIAFSPTIRNEFTWWDDPFTIHQHPSLNPPTLDGLVWLWRNAQFSLYVPVTQTAWWLLASIAYSPGQAIGQEIRLNPGVFHAGSVLVHGLAAGMACLLLRRLLASGTAAVLGALLFALHPVQVESVAWASGLKDLLCGLFALMALYQYLLYATPTDPDLPSGPTRLYYTLTFTFFGLAMLSKPGGVVVPVLAAVLDLLVLKRPWRTVARSVLPLLVLAIPVMIMTSLIQEQRDQVYSPALMRPLVAMDALGFYVAKLVLPIRLALDYGRRPIDVINGGWMHLLWVLPLVVAAAAGLAWRQSRLPATGFFLFVAALGPMLGLLPFHYQYYSTVADHYLYLAMFGPALVAGWLILTWPKRAVPAVIMVLAVLTGLSVMQIGRWRDDQALLGYTLQVNPRSFGSYNVLGVAELAAARRLSAGRPAEAADAYNRAAELFTKSTEANPEFIQAWQNLAFVLGTHLHRPDLAVEPLRKTLDLRDRYAETRGGRDTASLYLALGQTLERQGDVAGAVEVYEKLWRRMADPRASQALARLRGQAATPSPRAPPSRP